LRKCGRGEVKRGSEKEEGEDCAFLHVVIIVPGGGEWVNRGKRIGMRRRIKPL
jgi:hypothetical protein